MDAERLETGSTGQYTERAFTLLSIWFVANSLLCFLTLTPGHVYSTISYLLLISSFVFCLGLLLFFLEGRLFHNPRQFKLAAQVVTLVAFAVLLITPFHSLGGGILLQTPFFFCYPILLIILPSFIRLWSWKAHLTSFFLVLFFILLSGYFEPDIIDLPEIFLITCASLFVLTVEYLKDLEENEYLKRISEQKLAAEEQHEERLASVRPIVNTETLVKERDKYFSSCMLWQLAILFLLVSVDLAIVIVQDEDYTELAVAIAGFIVMFALLLPHRLINDRYPDASLLASTFLQVVILSLSINEGSMLGWFHHALGMPLVAGVAVLYLQDPIKNFLVLWTCASISLFLPSTFFSGRVAFSDFFSAQLDPELFSSLLESTFLAQQDQSIILLLILFSLLLVKEFYTRSSNRDFIHMLGGSQESFHLGFGE